MMRGTKYGNSRCEYDGIVFDSRKEMQRWMVLSEAERNGEISCLRRQVPYELIPTQYREETVHLKTKDKVVRKVAEKGCCYKADFVYEKDGITVVEDTKISKSLLPPEYIIKRKLMLYVHGIAIKEIYKASEKI